MKNKYVYNKQTSKLHIKGNCCHCPANEKTADSHYEFFICEDDVYKKYGRAVSMCKDCLKRRDKEVKL